MRRLAALTLSLGLLLGLAGGPMAQPTNAASLKICGEVTVYVKATALGTGLLTINGVPLVIAIGASLPASVQVGADLCIDLTTNLLGLVTGGAVSANVHAEVKVCGVVQAYTAASSEGERASLLLGTAVALLEAMGAAFKPFERHLHDTARDQARTLCGEVAFEEGRRRGAAMSLDDAIEEALTG